MEQQTDKEDRHQALEDLDYRMIERFKELSRDHHVGEDDIDKVKDEFYAEFRAIVLGHE